MSGIYMHAYDNILEIQATDYEIGVIIHLPAEVEAAGEAVVSGRYLQEVVRTLPDDEVSISYDRDTNICTITSGRATSSMTYDHHAPVSSNIAKAVLEEMKGRVDLV